MIQWFWNVEFGTNDKKWGLLFQKNIGSFFSVGVQGHFKDTEITTVE